jgi:hypothetical protein
MEGPVGRPSASAEHGVEDDECVQVQAKLRPVLSRVAGLKDLRASRE